MKIRTLLLSEKRLDWLDYCLAGFAGMTATYSVGMSLLRPTMGLFFVGFIAVGMLASFIVQRAFSGAKWLEFGGPIYFIFAICAMFYAQDLNSFLPDGGFAERELTVAAWLSWMVLLGSWVSWKDSTLLFQAVPSIALFGLVGAFNTFQGSTIAFFAFLLSLATLFARAHARAMLRQALDSGFSRLDTIRQGPWRWMAGPEWALASAAVVILVSLIGAPMLRASVKDISGMVRFPMPNLNRNNRNLTQPPIPGSASAMSNSVAIGTGPVFLGDRVVFQAKLDQERYLRMGSYSTYARGNWEKVPLERASAQIIFDETMRDRRKLVDGENYTKVPFEVSFEGMALTTLPSPGEVVLMDRPEFFDLQLDGGLGIKKMVPPNSTFQGTAAVLKPSAVPKNAPFPLPEYLWKYLANTDAANNVTNLAVQVSYGSKTDYEKALAIKAEIERRCKYNLNAERGPSNVDPVENFLFGEKKEGYCDLFATAMVLMARAVDIPARYVRGYYPLDGDKDNDGWFPVTESCSHAWAELYFEGVGWIVFDATEGAKAVPGGERGAINDGKSWYQRPWFMWTLNVSIGLSVLAAGFVAVRGGRQTRVTVDRSRMELARNYELFTSALQKASGRPRRPSQTASEYLDCVADQLGAAKDDAVQINGMFISALYAPPNAESSDASLREPIKSFRKKLKEASRRV